MTAPAPGIGQLISTVKDDPEIREAVKQLALDAIGEASRLLRVGSPTVKAQIIRSILPSATAGLKETPEDSSRGELLAAMGELMEVARGK